MTNPIVSIVYHSGYGHTAKQAEAVANGARKTEAEVFLYEVDGSFNKWEALTKSDAIIFGSPTYMGCISAQFKAFMDETSNTVFAAGFLWKDKIAAGFTNSASRAGDKSQTLSTLSVFAAQHGMHWVNLGLPPANNTTSGSEQDLNRLGFFTGAAAQSNADEGPEVAPPQADLLTASHLGERVATVAKQLMLGKQHLKQQA
ncbi:flavodoxin family protein [Oceanobacter antarcticus]|uniref:Flavodoxin family protein n=1 Tax=Oceanobacter antarcticus TaxID=3133425 RepID=A0ABW8NN36_9GAMM